MLPHSEPRHLRLSMMAIALALLAAIGFSGTSLLALRQSQMTARGRAYAIAVAAAVLLVLALGDLFPESLEMAGDWAIAGFIAGFALLFMIETLTHAHTHHAPDEHVHRHALAPFVLGLAFHNFADGFAIGASAEVGGTLAGLVGFGVLIHQVPVGLSLAAVFAAAHAARGYVVRVAVLLGLMIPLATVVTVAFPIRTASATGILLSIAGGILVYIATAHLLPEAQAENPSTTTALVFITTLLIMTIGLFTILGD